MSIRVRLGFNVVNAVFCISENTAGYFTLLEGLIERWGIPLALYSDRHAVFKHNARKPETAAEATQFTRSLQELGIRQIFARSPQAKGRVERAAGTFQDRLVTELRLAGARTMDQATAVLQDFLPRYNARFAVQPEHPEPAYRPADPDLCLPEILCFKDTRKVARDNTVKYHWRVLQLLPDKERTSYAGLRVEVLERPDGELIVRYEGCRVATQEPPPRIGALWAGVTAWSPGPELKRVVSSVGDHHISRSQQRQLAAPGTGASGRACPQTRRPERTPRRRTPPATQRTRGRVRPRQPNWPRWKAIQKGRLKGLSLRAISRELGISRVTVRKVRLCRETAHQETQRRGTRQAAGATQIHHRRQLAMRTFSLSIQQDGIAGQQHNDSGRWSQQGLCDKVR